MSPTKINGKIRKSAACLEDGWSSLSQNEEDKGRVPFERKREKLCLLIPSMVFVALPFSITSFSFSWGNDFHRPKERKKKERRREKREKRRKMNKNRSKKDGVKPATSSPASTEGA